MSCKLFPNCVQLGNALKVSWSSNCPKSNDFPHNFLMSNSTKKFIQNLRIKIFYQNHGHRFVLYYLIFAWVKPHVNLMRFTRLVKVKNISLKTIELVLALQNFL